MRSKLLPVLFILCLITRLCTATVVGEENSLTGELASESSGAENSIAEESEDSGNTQDRVIEKVPDRISTFALLVFAVGILFLFKRRSNWISKD